MAKNPTIGYTLVYPAKGGLETIAIPGTQTLGRVVSGSNFIVDINGAKKKSPGSVRQNSNTNMAPDGDFKGLYDFWRTASSGPKTRRTVAVSNGKIWADNSDGIYIDVTGAFSIFKTDNVVMETFFGLLVMAFPNNPNLAPLKYDQGAAVAQLGGNPPNSKYLRTWMDRLWHAGIDGAPDEVIGSVVDDPEDYSFIDGAQLISFDQGDQDPIGITALFPPFYNRLTVAKRRSIYYITFDGTNFAVTPVVSSGLGCVSHNGVQGLDSDVIFPSERGIHSMNMTNKLGQIDMNHLSASIQDFYQENVDFAQADNMRSIYIPELNHYFLALTTKASASNDVCLGYNFGQDEWDVMDQNISAFAKYVDPNDFNKTKAMVGDDLGRIGILDTAHHVSTVTWFDELVQTQVTTGIIYPMGANVSDVTFRQLTIYFKPQQVVNSVLKATCLVDGTQRTDVEFPMVAQSGALIGSAIIGSSKIGGRGQVKNVTRQIKGVGKGIEIILTHTPVSALDDCEIYGFVIEYEYSGDTDLTKSQ